MSLYTALKRQSQPTQNEAIPVGLIRHLRSERHFRTMSRPIELQKSLTGSPRSPGSPHSLFATFSGLANSVRVQHVKVGHTQKQRGKRTTGKELRLAAALIEVSAANQQARKAILTEHPSQKATWSTCFQGLFAYKNYSIPVIKQRNREALKPILAAQGNGRRHASLQ